MAQGFAPKLAQLQTIDSALVKYRTRLREIDTILGTDARIRAAQESLQAADQRRREALALTQKLDLERSSLITKRQAADEQLYSGRVNNPKELTELQQEVDALDRQLAKQDAALSAAQQAESQAMQDYEIARESLAQAEENFAHLQSDLVAEKKRISADFRSQAQLRKDITADLAPDVLARYDDLRLKKKGIAVARLRDGSCTVCGVELTMRVAQQVRAGELVTCESCGRLLIA